MVTTRTTNSNHIPLLSYEDYFMYGDKSGSHSGYSAVMVTLREKQTYVTAPNTPANLFRGVFQVSVT